MQNSLRLDGIWCSKLARRRLSIVFSDDFKLVIEKILVAAFLVRVR